MIESELPKMHQSQQDMDLIDILWRQDIDLGAAREVFDRSHRLKERELRKQRELEEEKCRQQRREQEEALLAQLQLDEETGEFVPRPPASARPQTTAAPPAATQNVIFTEEEEDALSFDECMQLLAETFPLVESIQTESPSPSVHPPANSGPVLTDPHQPPLMENHFLSTSQSDQKSLPDLERVWMELLSIPELQQCLDMQMEDMLEPADFAATAPPTDEQESDGSFYMSDHIDSVSPVEYLNTFEGPHSIVCSPDDLIEAAVKVPDLSATLSGEGFGDVFCPDQINTKQESTILPIGSGDVSIPLDELPKDTLLEPIGISDFVLLEGFESRKAEVVAEFPQSHLDFDSASETSSPEKLLCVNECFGNSDSNMEMEISAVRAEAGSTGMCASSLQTDKHQAPTPASSTSTKKQGAKARRPKTEPTESSGHNKPPFTKDKHKRSGESRFSRDEQQAKALQIPFTVDTIINLPVDDFNEMMSKQRLSEAQLSLVRDIRRRGKNKMAAQNCRKRKMENIVGLEGELESLKEERDQLLRERTEMGSSLREVKRQLNGLYTEVFDLLRNEKGQAYSSREYSLQQSADGNIFLIPRTKKTLVKSDGN